MRSSVVGGIGGCGRVGGWVASIGFGLLSKGWEGEEIRVRYVKLVDGWAGG